MKFVLVAAIFTVFAFARSPKDPSQVAPPETPQMLMDRGKAAYQRGDLTIAKKAFETLIQRFGDQPLVGSLAEDVDFGGAAAVNTYGDFAKHELKFLELEISSGKSRVFSDPKKALDDILSDIDLNEVSELRNKMWVRMLQGECGSEPDELTPDEAVDELRQELAPKNVKVKNYAAGTDVAPTMKIALKTDRYLELRLSKSGKGWIWNRTTICSRAL